MDIMCLNPSMPGEMPVTSQPDIVSYIYSQLHFPTTTLPKSLPSTQTDLVLHGLLHWPSIASKLLLNLFYHEPFIVFETLLDVHLELDDVVEHTLNLRVEFLAQAVGPKSQLLVPGGYVSCMPAAGRTVRTRCLYSSLVAPSAVHCPAGLPASGQVPSPSSRFEHPTQAFASLLSVQVSKSVARSRACCQRTSLVFSNSSSADRTRWSSASISSFLSSIAPESSNKSRRLSSSCSFAACRLLLISFLRLLM
jgi:hypothetical protein